MTLTLYYFPVVQKRMDSVFLLWMTILDCRLCITEARYIQRARLNFTESVFAELIGNGDS